MCFALYGIKTHRLSIEIDTNTFTFRDIGKLIYKKYLNENISQIIQRVLNRSNTRLTGFIILTNWFKIMNTAKKNLNRYFNLKA